MRISNLVTAVDSIQKALTDFLVHDFKEYENHFSKPDISFLLSKIKEIIYQTDRICSRAGGYPSDLPTRSLRAYQWLRFLSQRKWLWLHLHALAEFYHLAAKEFPLFVNQKNLQASLQINCYHSSYLYHCQKKGKQVILEINEGFISSPTDLKRSILIAALQRRSANRLKIIKQYSSSSEYKLIHANLLEEQIHSRLICKGQSVDLAEVYTEINQDYFKSQLEPARLVWSTRRSTRRLGYYHPETNTIAISKLLDSNTIPHYVIGYVMYHEMLHKKIGVKAVNGRRYAHTKAFKTAERNFKSYQQAEEFLKQFQQNIC